MHATEKEIEKYLSEIRDSLVCSSKLKNEIISEIEGLLYDFAERKEIRDISEIYEHFGTPEEMAKTYLSQADPKTIRNAIKFKKVVIVGVLFALLMLGIFYVSTFVDAHKSYESESEYNIVKNVIIDNSYIAQ